MAPKMANTYHACTKDLQDRFLSALTTKKDEIYKETNDCFSKAWLIKDDIESMAETQKCIDTHFKTRKDTLTEHLNKLQEQYDKFSIAEEAPEEPVTLYNTYVSNNHAFK
jgi:hypothetical protein